MAFKTLTGNGTTLFETAPGSRYAWKMGLSTGSGTVALQWRADGGGDFTYENGSLTATGGLEFVCVSNPTLVTVSGASGLVAYTDVILISKK